MRSHSYDPNSRRLARFGAGLFGIMLGALVAWATHDGFILRGPIMEMPTSKAVDLVQLINQREIGRFHLQLLGLCAAVVFMDGFDAQAIGYVAPSLSQAWHLAPGALGPVPA
jgi:hypothetical protein